MKGKYLPYVSNAKYMFKILLLPNYNIRFFSGPTSKKGKNPSILEHKE